MPFELPRRTLRPVQPGTLPAGARRRNGHSGASCVTMRDGSYADARRGPGAAGRAPRSPGGRGGAPPARARAALAHVIEMPDPDDLLKGGELVLTTGLGA